MANVGADEGCFEGAEAVGREGGGRGCEGKGDFFFVDFKFFVFCFNFPLRIG